LLSSAPGISAVSKTARVVLFLSIGAVLVAGLRWSQRQGGPLVVSGFVEADQIRVGSRLGGRVKVVHVEEGQHVEANTTLLELEPFDLPEQRAGAAARRGPA
jgi:multidrug efflux pump subunit AcrA (membrane-fusion protein)